MEEGVIVHASQYYDPVKAHEYYLRTRELKGRQARARLMIENTSKRGFFKARYLNPDALAMINSLFDKGTK